MHIIEKVKGYECDIEWWNAPYRKEGIKDGRKDIGK
jgi:hypothetical protein